MSFVVMLANFQVYRAVGIVQDPRFRDYSKLSDLGSCHKFSRSEPSIQTSSYRTKFLCRGLASRAVPISVHVVSETLLREEYHEKIHIIVREYCEKIYIIVADFE